MNKLLLASFALAAMAAGSAMAAEMPLKAPPPAPSWTGFYFGGAIGARWDNVDGSVTAATNNGVNILCLPPPASTGPCTGTQLNSTAFRPSAYFGYNWQLSSLTLAGIEGDVGWAHNISTLGGAIYPGGNNPFYLTQRSDDYFTFKSSWDGALRIRLGYLINPSTLLFVAGGVEFMQISTQSHCGQISDCTPGIFPLLYLPADISHTRTMAGGTVGGGIERMLTPHLLLRAEYRFADFGSASFTDTRVNPIGPPAGPITQVATYKTDVITQTALIGLAYKFDR